MIQNYYNQHSTALTKKKQKVINFRFFSQTNDLSFESSKLKQSNLIATLDGNSEGYCKSLTF